MSKELIRLRDLCMAFDDELVLDHINLYINDSEFLTLLGPSGCGKTTTLRIIGGFTTPTSGDVTFDGVRINDVPPHKRQINTVFQKYALFPHLDVFENIAFGLRIAKVPAEEIEERVTEMLGVVSLKGFEHRKITQLSGGQQQRVAIARALVNRPKVLLLDEPLGALDLRLRNICMAFDDEQVLDNINLYFNDSEFLTLLGPSGCGKTTTLRIIGGFTTPTGGDVIFDGVRINDVPPHKRQINTVFQKYALFPHLDVFENIAFGLRIAKVPEEEIRERVTEMLGVVSLKGFEKRRVDQLSGGQQQRVAIARALVNRPKVLLLDEPLGALDLRLRKDMQNELKRIQQQMGITFIYVTHDQEEALTMSDTVVVMDKGRIQQIGTPEDIYNEPKNAFVADFIGESNILDGVMHEDYVVEFFNRKFKCLDKGFAPMEPVDVVIRPEDIEIVPADKGRLVGTVTSVTFKGVHYDTIVDFKGYKWLIQTTDYHEVGEVIGIILNPDDIHIMKKSEYSGQFGDYSSYSAEYDEINDPDFAEEDEEDADDED